MKRHYAPFGVLAIITLLFMACLLLTGQTTQRSQVDKVGVNIGANNTVTWTPGDVGVKAASILTATTVSSNQINFANSHTVLVAVNCNQAIATVALQPVFEDGTLGTSIPIGTTLTTSQWDYMWLSDTMTESAVGATAGTARLPIGAPSAQLTINNASGSTATCNARVIVQY